MLTWIKRHAAVIGFLILAIGMFLAIGGVKAAIDNTNHKDNKTRCAVVGLVETLSDNSRRSAAATLASPTATPAQKTAAAKNLKDINDYVRITYTKLGQPHGPACPAPTS